MTSRDFMLVPRYPALEQHLGKQVSVYGHEEAELALGGAQVGDADVNIPDWIGFELPPFLLLTFSALLSQPYFLSQSRNWTRIYIRRPREKYCLRNR
jgi:hypothetical protein